MIAGAEEMNNFGKEKRTGQSYGERVKTNERHMKLWTIHDELTSEKSIKETRCLLC